MVKSRGCYSACDLRSLVVLFFSSLQGLELELPPPSIDRSRKGAILVPLACKLMLSLRSVAGEEGRDRHREEESEMLRLSWVLDYNLHSAREYGFESTLDKVPSLLRARAVFLVRRFSPGETEAARSFSFFSPCWFENFLLAHRVGRWRFLLPRPTSISSLFPPLNNIHGGRSESPSFFCERRWAARRSIPDRSPNCVRNSLLLSP